ncbi:MAG: hypothetical protein LC659_12700, partial [Myxococcales bacterium]|nr:hypothetical protein [Myxococcales bacterium]
MMRFAPVAVLMFAACSSSQANPCTGWTQWSQSADHSGHVCVAGQAPAHILANLQVDPFAGAETQLAGGDILVHYQVPLVVGDDVYTLHKLGDYPIVPCGQAADGSEIDCAQWDAQIWTEEHWHWSGDKLLFDWSAGSDWKPVPSQVAGSEPLFQPVVVGDNLYLPAGGGAVRRLDRHTGIEQARISPLAGAFVNPDVFVSGPLVADAKGNIYYNVVEFAHGTFTGGQGTLIRIAPDDTFQRVSYDTMLGRAYDPAAANCHGTYASLNPPPPLPWPPLNPDGSTMMVPLIACGSQRPGINVAPTIGPDGTIFTVSRADATSQDSYVIALNRDLSTKWVATLRGILNDACGVNVPTDGDAGANKYDCTPGTPMGVDRGTGLP